MYSRKKQLLVELSKNLQVKTRLVVLMFDVKEQSKRCVYELVEKISLTETGAEARHILEVEGQNYTVEDFLAVMSALNSNGSEKIQ
ncbi:hypothetical protein GTO91_08980 [Heliobacterium undosum]|uniref:Uncharacterized protein n=1 Tax=Heliomicrobium undosum TaxID=121734 RepID=A0A845L3W6_9FIRM|nr:hypothetical protein [Heliomicrobium undosum]MZP29839.1 hypothetical protein [Heliomicrobium undosum]